MKLTVQAQNERILPRMSIKQVALRSLQLDWIGMVGGGGGDGLFQGTILSAPGLALHSNNQPTHPWVSLQLTALWCPGTFQGLAIKIHSSG